MEEGEEEEDGGAEKKEEVVSVAEENLVSSHSRRPCFARAHDAVCARDHGAS